jgi:biotin-(acetyl-CoA carboxylase) ligase
MENLKVLREQIQEDLISYLEDVLEQEEMDAVCQIVVDRFFQYEIKLKATIATTTHDESIANEIAKEMTEMVGTEFRVEHIKGLPSGDFYRIEGEITADKYMEMQGIINEWFLVDPTNDWIALFDQ